MSDDVSLADGSCEVDGHKWHRWVGQMNALGRDYDECDRCGMRRSVTSTKGSER